LGGVFHDELLTDSKARKVLILENSFTTDLHQRPPCQNPLRKPPSSLYITIMIINSPNVPPRFRSYNRPRFTRQTLGIRRITDICCLTDVNEFEDGAIRREEGDGAFMESDFVVWDVCASYGAELKCESSEECKNESSCGGCQGRLRRGCVSWDYRWRGVLYSSSSAA
jgi:hypothetical protein